MTDEILHEEADHRGTFYIERNGTRIARMSYRRVNAGVVTIDHTEVDATLRGEGIGRRLLDAAVAWARATETKFQATCSFASAQFTKDASIRDVHA